MSLAQWEKLCWNKGQAREDGSFQVPSMAPLVPAKEFPPEVIRLDGLFHVTWREGKANVLRHRLSLSLAFGLSGIDRIISIITMGVRGDLRFPFCFSFTSPHE